MSQKVGKVAPKIYKSKIQNYELIPLFVVGCIGLFKLRHGASIMQNVSRLVSLPVKVADMTFLSQVGRQ